MHGFMQEAVYAGKASCKNVAQVSRKKECSKSMREREDQIGGAHGRKLDQSSFTSKIFTLQRCCFWFYKFLETM